MHNTEAVQSALEVILLYARCVHLFQDKELAKFFRWLATRAEKWVIRGPKIRVFTMIPAIFYLMN